MEIVVNLSQENAITLFAAAGALQFAWAIARLDGRETGATELRQALAAFTDQGNKLDVPFFQGLLAEIEAEGDVEGALTRIDEALALAGETGEHWSDAFLHRCRGEILLKRDPSNTAPAEDVRIFFGFGLQKLLPVTSLVRPNFPIGQAQDNAAATVAGIGDGNRRIDRSTYRRPRSKDALCRSTTLATRTPAQFGVL